MYFNSLSERHVIRQLQEECIEDIVMTHATLLCVLTTIFQILQTINGSRWVSGSFEMNDQALDSLRPKGAKLLLLNSILLVPATEDPATAAEDTSEEVVVSSLFGFVKVPNVKTVNTLGLPCTKISSITTTDDRRFKCDNCRGWLLVVLLLVLF